MNILRTRPILGCSTWARTPSLMWHGKFFSECWARDETHGFGGENDGYSSMNGILSYNGGVKPHHLPMFAL